ncbi:unnamed protein product [Natator depressus]
MPQRRRLCGKGRCSGAMTALDAPSPSLRSAVQSPDRLACASPLINQRDCEGLGCCYNPSDRMNLYYYGNTDGWRPGCVPPAHSHRQGCENLESGLCHFGQHLQVTWWRSGSCRELTQIWFCTTDGPLPVPTPSSSCSGRSWCLYTDNYRTQLVPVGTASGLQFPSHHQRFVVSNFTFVESAFQRVLTGVRFLQFCHEAKSCSGVPALHHFHVLAL